MPDDATQVGDTWISPNTDETTDEAGNTVIVGYPPDISETYSVTPGMSADGPGLGIGIGDPSEGEGA